MVLLFSQNSRFRLEKNIIHHFCTPMPPPFLEVVMIAFLDLQGCFLMSWYLQILEVMMVDAPMMIQPVWSNSSAEKVGEESLSSIWRCWNPGSTVWQESPQNKGGEIFFKQKTDHAFIYVVDVWVENSYEISERFLSDILNIHIFGLRLRGIVYPLLPPATQRKFRFLSADEAVCTVQARVTMTQLDQIWHLKKNWLLKGKNGCENSSGSSQIWIFWEGFRNDCRNFHSKHGINSGWTLGCLQGRSIVWFVACARNYKVPTVRWRCNKSCKITVATERRSWGPASQVSLVENFMVC